MGAVARGGPLKRLLAGGATVHHPPVRPDGASPPRRPARGALHVALPTALAVVLFAVADLSAQIPDTLPGTPDTVVVEGTPPGDTIPEEVGDTLAADTSVTVLPPLPETVEPGWATGVWAWDREDLLVTRALTLEDLLSEIPGAVPLRGGDYGNPRTVSAFGAAAGRIRVFRDGVEVVPLGGSPDLSRISLAGVGRVRAERHPGGLRVELTAIQVDDPRPYSRVEAGTGDLETNFFRGTFSHPRAFGGNVAVALDRVDTEGRRRREPSSSSGWWARYQRTFGEDERWGAVAEVHRITSDTEAGPFLPEVTRTDWVLRARRVLRPGWVAHAFAVRTQWEGKDSADVPVFEVDRDQLGVGLHVEEGLLAGRADVRGFRGEGLPTWAGEAEVSGRLPALGGAALTGTWSSWDLGTASRFHLRGWTREWRGLSAFAGLESGSAAAPFVSGLLPERAPGPIVSRPTDPRHTDRDAIRAGASFRWRGLEIEGAWIRLEADSLIPLGLPVDSAGMAVPGGTSNGIEARARIPLLLLDSLRLEGWWQGWDEPRRYLPEHVYHGQIAFHDVFLESGNFELWVAVGVRGRDPMEVAVPAAAAPSLPVGPGGGAVVPSYQSWYGRLQIRIVTVHAFLEWDNFTVREGLRDFPDRLLPRTRAIYGVRWTLWN